MKNSLIKMLAWSAALSALPLTASAQSQPSTAAADAQQAEDIVVIGRRSGVPLWRVTGAETSLVLVGAIQGVSKTTKWDPEALTEALRKADRVMFPQAQAFTVGSPFKLIGWLAKWKAMGSLPKGQSLADFIGPEELQRLAALTARGAVQPNYLQRHPLHLANDLRERAKGDVEYGSGAADYVRKAVRKHKLAVTVDPIAKSKAKPVVKDLFASSPQEHVACLRAAIAAAEAGPAAAQARSDAWAARRVREVLQSPANPVYSTCWPEGFVSIPRESLVAEMEQLLREPRLTMAVLTLDALAETGGILDRLEAAGYDIQGPPWK